jgi:hypothetical protein
MWVLIILQTGNNVSKQPIYQITEHFIPEHHIQKTVIRYTNMKYKGTGTYIFIILRNIIFLPSLTVWEPNLQNWQKPKLWPHILTKKC